MRRVLVEVDEDALAALLLPPRVGHLIGIATRHLARERHCGRSHLVRIPPRLEPQVHVDAVLAGGLRVSDDAELVEQRAHQVRDRARPRSRCRVWVEVDAQLVGVIGIVGARRPHVEAEAAEVHGPRDVREVGDHERVTTCRWAC